MLYCAGWNLMSENWIPCHFFCMAHQFMPYNGIYVLHHMGLVHGDWALVKKIYLASEYYSIYGAAPVRIAYVTVTPSQREWGQDSRARYILVCYAKTKNLLRNYPIRFKVDIDQHCILSCNAKPCELTRNYPIRIEIDILIWFRASLFSSSEHMLCLVLSTPV